MKRGQKIRFGLVGVGGIGAHHARRLLAGEIPRATLTAAADVDARRLATLPRVRGYADANDMFQAGEIDVALIATPHRSHVPLAQAAFRAGLHVLVEKPIAISIGDARQLAATPRAPGQIFGAVLNQRTDPAYRRIRDLLRRGELGPVRRVQWTMTDWFRPNAYFAHDSWRGTWAGEGGGLLINQALHNLDILWWLLGSPVRVHGHARFGRHHPIEVEDEVTAVLEYGDGATAVFTTSSGEAPPTERLEIAGDRGLLRFEAGELAFHRARQPLAEFIRSAPGAYQQPKFTTRRWQFADRGSQHAGILADFAAAILDQRPPLAPGEEGCHSVEIANAIVLSSHLGRPVDLPLSSRRYAAFLRDRLATSRRP